MNLSTTTVPIEPRSLGECLDLALLFARGHARPLLSLTLAFALPGVAITATLVAFVPGGWAWSTLVLFLTCPLLGTAIVAAAGRVVFGEPFEQRVALRAVARVWPQVLLGRLVTLAAGLPCLGVTALFADAHYACLPEVLVLEQMRGRDARRRLGDLGGPFDPVVLGRRGGLLLFLGIAVLALYTAADQVAGLLLGQPLGWSRIDARFLDHELALWLADPLAMAALAATLWLVYPVTRLAWFFCYLDTRIRREGWDLELAFRLEARRLERIA